MVEDASQKTALFSFTNFRADYWKLFKSLSLAMFIDRFAFEAKDWVGKVEGLPSEEHEAFIKHVQLFGNYLFKYSATKDTATSTEWAQTGDALPAGDFYHRWQRFEDQNANAVHERIRTNYPNRTRQNVAL